MKHPNGLVTKSQSKIFTLLWNPCELSEASVTIFMGWIYKEKKYRKGTSHTDTTLLLLTYYSLRVFDTEAYFTMKLSFLGVVCFALSLSSVLCIKGTEEEGPASNESVNGASDNFGSDVNIPEENFPEQVRSNSKVVTQKQKRSTDAVPTEEETSDRTEPSSSSYPMAPNKKKSV